MIRVENVSKQFNKTRALKNVSLEVNKGDIISLIGPSGSGKSTLLRCIHGLEHVDTGKIYMDNEWMNPDDEKKFRTQRNRMGFVFQHFNLFPNMSVLQNCKLAQVEVLNKTDEEAEKIAEFYDVPIEVITGKMNIEDIPAINKDGLSELKFLSRKWIYDNSHCEDTKYRVEMLNLILSNSKCADLFFDTLSAFVNGFFIGTNSLQYAYSKSEIEHILFKGFILEELDEFFKNLYRRTSIYRENRVEEKINEIFERMKQSKEILKQSRLNEETQELEMIHQENEDMKNEINNIN